MGTTPDLRQAAQQALEAMRLAASNHDVMLLSDPPQDAWKARNVAGELSEAIIALEAALAEPQPEPVFEVGFGWLDDATKYPKGTKFYTAPPQRQPLTDMEIARLCVWSLTEADRIDSTPAYALARAIEKAHGIGGDK